MPSRSDLRLMVALCAGIGCSCRQWKSTAPAASGERLLPLSPASLFCGGSPNCSNCPDCCNCPHCRQHSQTRRSSRPLRSSRTLHFYVACIVCAGMRWTSMASRCSTSSRSTWGSCQMPRTPPSRRVSGSMHSMRSMFACGAWVAGRSAIPHEPPMTLPLCPAAAAAAAAAAASCRRGCACTRATA